MKKPVALVILDGIGEASPSEGNAFLLAKTPNIDKLREEYPSILMNASGELVGLPKGQMGNSEVGHLNLGAGRIVYQSLTFLNKQFEEGKVNENKELIEAINFAKENNSNVHMFALASDGGVHSHIDHIIGLNKILNDNSCNVFLHAITDGRDTGQSSAIGYIEKLLSNNIEISSISGRYYAMDRDKRWDRMQLAYDVIADRVGDSYTDSIEYINSQYEKGTTDEFFIPAYNENSTPIRDNDVVICVNFRPDRVRQLTHMIKGSMEEVTGYDYSPKQGRLNNIHYVSIKQYPGIQWPSMFQDEPLVNLFGEVVQSNGLSQMRAAETEKYPHVTYFFDGQQEIEKELETRILVHSPNVPTYDLQPEMSSVELSDRVVEEAKNNDVIIVNFAQTDMVGHTGSIPAAIAAVEAADAAMGKLYKEIVENLGGVILMVADHGNCEKMLNEDGTPCTTHTTNPVKLVITDKEVEFDPKFTTGVVAKLGDISPTMLKLLNVEVPVEMTGDILIK